MNRWLLVAVLFLTFACPATLRADPRLATQPGQTTETYPLGSAEPNSTVERIRLLLGGGTGQVMFDRANNTVVVMATADQHLRIKELLRSNVTFHPRNVQIAVRIIDRGAAVDRGIAVGVTSTNVASPYPTRQTSIDAAIAGQSKYTRTEATQFVTVLSGGRGSILVAQEIPYTDWFLSYGTRFGYVRAETKWQQVGATLLIEPELVGDGSWIRVRVTPELSYFVDRQRFSTVIINTSTDLNCRNGQEISLAQQTSNQEFFQRFLTGYDSARHLRAVDIVIRATTLQ